MTNTSDTICLECDGEGYLPDTGKQADSFRLCPGCNGKGRISAPKIDKSKTVTVPSTK